MADKEAGQPADDEKKPEAEGATGKEKKKDPFDPVNVRAKTDYGGKIRAEKKLLGMSCRNPKSKEWIQVNPSPEYQLQVNLLKMDRGAGGSDEVYLIDPDMATTLMEDCYLANIFVAVNRQNDAFLWACREPDEDRPLEWHKTALDAAEQAQSEWIKVRANMGTGRYDIFTIKSLEKQPDPVFPKQSLRELLRLTFREYYIDSPDHIVVKKITGT